MEVLDAGRIFGVASAGRVIGCKGEVLEVVDSTMDVARRRAAAGAPDGYVLLAEKQRVRRRSRRHGRRRRAKTALTLAGVFPGLDRMVVIVIVLIAVGGLAWGYHRMLGPRGKTYMVKCKACGETFPHKGHEESAFDLKCRKCKERRANTVFVCRQCGQVMWLNSPHELDGKLCPVCNSPRVGFAYPGGDGMPGTIERIKRDVQRRTKERQAAEPAREKPERETEPAAAEQPTRP